MTSITTAEAASKRITRRQNITTPATPPEVNPPVGGDVVFLPMENGAIVEGEVVGIAKDVTSGTVDIIMLLCQWNVL